MGLKLAAASGGSIELNPTNTASNFTVTVPAKTGTMAMDGPAFSVYISANFSTTSNVGTKIPFNTENFDTASAFDSTTNYRFTPLVAGYYQVSGYVGYTFTSGTAISVIYKNGSRFKDGVFSSGQTDGTGTTVDCLIYLNGSTDYIELYTYQRTGSSQNTFNSANSTYFQAVLVRAA